MDRTTEIGQPWQDRQDSTVKLGHDIWGMTSAITLDRTAQTCQSEQVVLTDQPGQVRQDRTERMGCQDMTARTGLSGGELGTRAMEQDSWERTGRTGQVDKI